MSRFVVNKSHCNFCGYAFLLLRFIDIDMGVEVAFDAETKGEKRAICDSCLSQLHWKPRKRKHKVQQKLTDHVSYKDISEPAPLFVK